MNEHNFTPTIEQIEAAEDAMQRWIDGYCYATGDCRACGESAFYEFLGELQGDEEDEQE